MNKKLLRYHIVLKTKTKVRKVSKIMDAVNMKDIVLEVGRDFVVPGDVLFQSASADVVDPRATLKSCLSHLVHKFINTNPQIKRLKQSCRNQDGTYKCPGCLNPRVNHLTGAHIGERVSTLIETVLTQNPNETDICAIWPKLVELHRTLPVMVVCARCNSRVDDTIINRLKNKSKVKLVIKAKKANVKVKGKSKTTNRKGKSKANAKRNIQKFIVEEIQSKKNEDGEIMYFVKWEGYDESESTWEPRTNLIKDVPHLVREYETLNTTQPRSFYQMLTGLSGLRL